MQRCRKLIERGAEWESMLTHAGGQFRDHPVIRKTKKTSLVEVAACFVYGSVLAGWLVVFILVISGWKFSLRSTSMGYSFPVSDSVEVIFLANEGFLLRSGSTAVLIDAFVTKPYSIYEAVSPDTYQQLVSGSFPYQDVKLALASHVHRDHFQPEAAGAFLQHHPDVRFISSRQVRDTLQTHFPDYDDIERQVQVLWPAPGEEERLETGALKVDFLRLRHTNLRNYGIENLGHIIHIGNKTFLHIGDAEMLAKHYQEYNLASRNLDVAFIPFWFFLSEEGRNIAENHINAAQYVAMHIPPDEYDEILSNLKQHFPKAIVFDKTGHLKRF